MSAQALRGHQINAPGQNGFQVVHQQKISVKVFTTRLEGHKKINITLRVNRLITRKRAEDGAACETHRPQGVGIHREPSQNIRAMGDRGDPRTRDEG
jgi:hypothetical protein